MRLHSLSPFGSKNVRRCRDHQCCTRNRLFCRKYCVCFCGNFMLKAMIHFFISFVLVLFVMKLLSYERRFQGLLMTFFSISREFRPDNSYESLVFRKKNWETRTNDLPICDWAREEPLYLPDVFDDAEQILITWLNEFNITYTLVNGALIGAFRHQGKIPDDLDLDILVPAWLNFGCEKPSAPKGGSQPCNFKKTIFFKRLAEESFEKRIVDSGAPFFVEKVNWKGLRLHRKKVNYMEREFYVDVYFLFPKSRLFPFFSAGTCRCWYRDVPAQCVPESAALAAKMRNETIEELMTPKVAWSQRKFGARNAFSDRSIKNPLHPKWKEIGGV